MFQWSRVQVLPIGIDIGFESVKLLQCQVIGSALSVVAAGRAALPEEACGDSPARLAVAVDLIRKLLQQQPFLGRRVVTCLPREAVQIKNLRLPMIPPNELSAVVEFEARNIFPFESEPAVIQYLPAGEVRQGTETRQELIVLGAKHAEINNFIEQIHRTGAVLESLDVEPCALFRAFEKFIRRKEDESEVQVLIDVGARRTQVIIARGRDISFYKTIDLGSGNLHDAVSRKLNISVDEAKGLRRRLMDSPDAEGADIRRDPVRQAVFDATRSIMEDLGREISLCLRYYSVTFRGQRPARVRVIGGEGNDARLISLLNATLSIPVESGRPLYSVDCEKMRDADRQGAMSEWTLALGLGLKLAKGTFAPRDGKARHDAVPAPAQVVDLNQALKDVSQTEVAHA